MKKQGNRKTAIPKDLKSLNVTELKYTKGGSKVYQRLENLESIVNEIGILINAFSTLNLRL